MNETNKHNTLNLSQPIPQARFAALVGISQPAVSDFVNRGILPQGGTASDWLLAYANRLREQAAGRQGQADGAYDLVAERARLNKEQADKVSMDNAVRRRELAPVTVMSATLGELASRIVPILEALPVRLRRECGFDAAAIDMVTAEIIRARNEVAGLGDIFEEVLEKMDG